MENCEGVSSKLQLDSDTKPVCLSRKKSDFLLLQRAMNVCIFSFDKNALKITFFKLFKGQISAVNQHSS